MKPITRFSKICLCENPEESQGSQTWAKTCGSHSVTACYLHGRYQQPEAKKTSLEEKFQGTMWLPNEEDSDIKEYLPHHTYERVTYEKNSWEQTPCSIFESFLKTQLEKISAPDLRKQLDNGAQRALKLVELLGLEAATKSFCEILGHAQLTTNKADETKKQLRDMRMI